MNRTITIIILIVSAFVFLNQSQIEKLSLFEEMKNKSFLVSFFENSKYEASHDFMGTIWYNSGTYKIKNNSIYLTPKICKERRGYKENIPCYNTLGEAVCSIKKLEKAFDFPFHFVCESKNNSNIIGNNKNYISRPITKIRFEKNTISKINDVDVYLIGPINRKTRGDVFFRELPNLNSQAMSIGESIDGPFFDFIPRNSNIVVYAKSKKTDKIQDKTNHWYYIEFQGTNGWIFGEFIE